VGTKTPLQTLEATYAKMEELIRFATLEWDVMTEDEHSESNEVIADLEDAARELREDFQHEILLERQERANTKFEECMTWMRHAYARGAYEEALERERAAHDLLVIVGILNLMLAFEGAQNENIEDTL